MKLLALVLVFAVALAIVEIPLHPIPKEAKEAIKEYQRLRKPQFPAE
jgi:hypothetical protein